MKFYIKVFTQGFSGRFLQMKGHEGNDFVKDLKVRHLPELKMLRLYLLYCWYKCWSWAWISKYWAVWWSGMLSCRSTQENLNSVRLSSKLSSKLEHPIQILKVKLIQQLDENLITSEGDNHKHSLSQRRSHYLDDVKKEGSLVKINSATGEKGKEMEVYFLFEVLQYRPFMKKNKII